MTDVAGGEDPWRRHLHAAADYILDGPGSGDMDEWVTQALASLGLFFRAAGLALDYEAGRIKAGDVDRRRGIFPAGGYVYPLWQRASIWVEKSTADAWCQAGGEARDAPLSPETVQRILAAILDPIANTSCDVWLCHLADALDALQYGERPLLLKPSSKGLHPIGQGRTAYRLRLCALQHAEFVQAAGLKSETAALKSIAEAYGRDRKSIRAWLDDAKKELGRARVNEALRYARACGENYRIIQDRKASGVEPYADLSRRLDHFEEIFGDERLKLLGKAFIRLPRKLAAARRKSTS